MKKLLTLIMAVVLFLFMMAAWADAIVLHPGINECPAGQMVALEAITGNASPSIKLEQIYNVSLYTNAYMDVETIHTAYYFQLTNWNGEASITTNVLDRFNRSDWIIDGTNHVVGSVYEYYAFVTNQALIGRLPSQTFSVTNSLISTNAINHRLYTAPQNTVWLSGAGHLLLSGIEPEDIATLIIK